MGIRFETAAKSYTGPREFPNGHEIERMSLYNDTLPIGTPSEFLGLDIEPGGRGRYVVKAAKVVPKQGALELTGTAGATPRTIKIDNYRFELTGIEVYVKDQEENHYWGKIYPDDSIKTLK